MKAAILALAALAVSSAAAAPFLPVERADDFRPFALKSTAHAKRFTSAELEARYMCRRTSDVARLSQHLVETYDVLSTGRDGSLRWVSFRGEQDGKPATVILMVSSIDGIVKGALVNGRPALGCDHSNTQVNAAGVRIHRPD